MSSRGFSIVEMMIITIILGIFAAISVPMFSSASTGLNPVARPTSAPAPTPPR